jgi:hypothetical protein
MPRYATEIDGREVIVEAANPDEAGKLIAQKMPQAQTTREKARAEGEKGSARHAAAVGLQAGTLRNYQDELAGVVEASGLPVGTPAFVAAPVGIGKLAYGAITGDETASKRYSERLEQARGYYEGLQKAHPWAATGGEMVGGFAGPKGSNVYTGAALNAADAAAAGAGAGEDVESRGTGAAIGGGVGGVLGLAVPAVTDLARSTYRGVRGLIGNAAEYVNREAVNTVANAMRRDLQRMDPAERQQYLQRHIMAGQTGQGMEMVIADFGDQETRNLFRSATNISSDAHGQGERVVGDRYRGQQERFFNWWDQRTGRPNAYARNEALQDAARRANEPAYRAAYNSPSAQSVWSDDLQTLTTSDAVRKAIRDTTRTSSDYAALAGQRQAPRNPFVEAADGTLVLPPGETPSLQFWDHVQRNLRAAEEAAPRGGEEARRIQALRRQLNEQLDAHVPEFGQARAGAAAQFGAQDALEAGQNFLKNPTRSSAETRAALARFNPHERELFENGLIDSVRQQVAGISDQRDITKLFRSPELQERLTIGLGPGRAAELQGFMEVERGMDRLRGALGNSSTARQLIQSGAMGAAAGAGSTGLTDQDLSSSTGIGALIAMGLSSGRGKMNTAVMTRVGQLLMSQDPADVQAVQTAIARNPTLRSAFNGMIQRVEAVIGQQSGEAGAEAQTGVP